MASRKVKRRRQRRKAIAAAVGILRDRPKIENFPDTLPGRFAFNAAASSWTEHVLFLIHMDLWDAARAKHQGEI